MNQEIKKIIESYQSIIDLEEEKEVMHLIADLDQLFRENLSSKDKQKVILTKEEYAMANLGNDNPKPYKEYLEEI